MNGNKKLEGKTGNGITKDKKLGLANNCFFIKKQLSILQLRGWLPSLLIGVSLRVTLLWYKSCCFSNANFLVIMLTRYSSLSQQGHLQPHSKSKAWQLSKNLEPETIQQTEPSDEWDSNSSDISFSRIWERTTPFPPHSTLSWFWTHCSSYMVTVIITFSIKMSIFLKHITHNLLPG